ncbi:Uncharacterised protein [Cedecea neteri]|uniref:N-acetyltransferase domain-containing protein n=1 Tax=Cedecea neteri TaxID=158822 RepID=A0A2X2T2J7_9ENTR|nr:Uncharacterised protein [Cedecea neteri]
MRLFVATSQREGEMPLTFIALDGEKMVGTVGLWRCDLISRQDLWPWLAALYIDESQRGKGLGELLQRHVAEYARGLVLGRYISIRPVRPIMSGLAGVTLAMGWITRPARTSLSTYALTVVARRNDRVASHQRWAEHVGNLRQRQVFGQRQREFCCLSRHGHNRVANRGQLRPHVA